MSLVIKAFLERNDDSRAEIRRFAVPADASASYTYIFKKVSEVFPGLVTGHFNLYWKDGDGDLISFSTDEELFVNDSVFKIYIREHVNSNNNSNSSSNGGSSDVLHPGVVCDNCEGVVRGARYKCSVCPDFDLCSDCEAKKPHPEHEMWKIDAPFISCGPGNMPFRPPPYFRRWMKRYMNRWHSKNGGGCGTEQNDPTCGTQPDCQDGGEKEETTPEDECPPGMGDFAAMMDPFAIHMGFEMDNSDLHHGGGMHGRRGGRGWRGGWGGWGKFRGHGHGHGHGQGQGHCHRRRGQGQCPRFTNKDEEMKETGDNKQQCCGESTQANKMPPCEATVCTGTDEPVTDKMKDLQLNENGGRRTDRDGGWTLLSGGSPTAPSDPKIAEALQQMKLMGFTDDGGWLTRLLEAKNGDISQVLDAVKPAQGQDHTA